MMKMCNDAEAACSRVEKGDFKDVGDIPIVFYQVKKSVDIDSKGMGL
jgi:hypothetical protein